MMKSEVFTQGDIKPSLPSTIKLDHSREDRTMDDLRYYSKRDIITSDNEDDENESLGLPETELQDYIQRVYGVQQWPDGCEYRGEFGRNMKLGYGVFEWKNGEKYRGQFYKDHRHGSGTYSWPDGCTFTGTFYLSHREGYGTMYLKNRVFQGLYRADQRFGPGIESYAEGYQDVGWWFREHIIKLCMEVPGTFSILDYPEYIPFLTFDSEKGCHSEEELTKWDLNEEEDPFFYDYKRFLLNEDLTLPPEMYVYSTDNEHLPVTPGSKKDFDFYFLMPKFPIFDDEEEPWFVINQSPLILKIQKHACRFRHTKVQYIRSINDIMNGNRSNFGQRGPKERLAKELIVKSIKGDFDRVYEILRDDLVLADVADSRGFTALAAATIHSHNAIINLLLDNGANVNVSTDEGVTPLCMCFVLYYSNEKFKPNIAERNLVIKPTVKPSKAVSVGTTMPEIKFPSPATTLESTFQTSSLDMRRVLDKTASSLDGTISQLSKSQSESRSGILKRDESVMTPSERAVSSEGSKMLDEIRLTVEQTTRRSLSTNFESNLCVYNYPIQVSKDIMEKTANTYASLKSKPYEGGESDPGTVRKMALSIIEHNLRWATIELLLKRGADPNYCKEPMHVIFFPVRAADVTGVQLLLEHGARTDVRFPSKMRALSPLHIAVALPLEAGIRITELLLHALADPDTRAEDQDEGYKRDKFDTLISSMKLNNERGPPLSYYTPPNLQPEEGGRSPLHVVCEREDNFKYVREIVRLLLIHKADPNTLWSGHSPLSLSIASGNDLAVHELLLRGADPNLPLTKGVGSALCAAANLSFEQKRSVDGKIALVDRLIQFGADILLPVKLVQGDKTAVGTAVDYAYFKFFQDRRLAHTPLHSLTTLERETLVMRKKFLEYMGSRLRRAVLAKEEQWDRKLLLMSKKAELSSRTKKKTLVPSVAAPVIKPEDPKIPFFKYCYQCGRSIGVRLTPCLRCYGILTCSKHCKAKAWNESHKRECGAAKGETKVKEEEKKAKEMALKAQKDVKNVKTKKQDKLGSASWPKTPVTPSPPPYSENYSFV
ncbi:ankyrin repeat and MYND domain-containing protein 1 isoform X2 [Monodelphis domestica]|uniref:Ankyrin repeat and MYND domain containing 1 n=2 Tax=Monodelphis domestica TaxID=13616 RepID=F7FMY3_MONDO|nr:ankyrin repeat and MYND domain-containing protein 1 isoform X2 [Monodelphis domestica]XP_016284856.1 ankyrin repeat and MYND domain-containing protein 1 isoform X2 [Monodelphis domestica]XP_056675796.1 ankyrin repeat and MYND domain-containing protein 1 isoform X2 [Monodelphis domestica]XP_056675797.1 ankyrin repeat and MYND domain-containing protein 1 isoform X2 [Monodelphis domestica]